MSSHTLASINSSTAAKFRNTKISSKGLDGKSAKFCTSENFLLYGNTCTCMYTTQRYAKFGEKLTIDWRAAMQLS